MSRKYRSGDKITLTGKIIKRVSLEEQFEVHFKGNSMTNIISIKALDKGFLESAPITFKEGDEIEGIYVANEYRIISKFDYRDEEWWVVSGNGGLDIIKDSYLKDNYIIKEI